MNSEKEKNFKKVASRRTQKVIDNLRLLSNCSNKNNYAYSQEEVNKIFKSIDSELKVCKALFNKNKARQVFKL
tara:strand:+ start:748 stop:966 length:219 start_codon:yes stop_codon:yes gene_type:complete